MVEDPDKEVFKWDGVTRSIEPWNRDHTLRSAIAASVVPVYQEIARKIGPERMQKYLDMFDYGNRKIGGGIDQFWLTGDLRIDPMQQIDFVDRLRRGALPVSKRSQDLVRDIMPVTKVGNATIRAKTGLARRGAGQAVAGLGGRLGGGRQPADRVRHEHGLQGARPHRRAHDGGAAVSRGYRCAIYRFTSSLRDDGRAAAKLSVSLRPAMRKCSLARFLGVLDIRVHART